MGPKQIIQGALKSEELKLFYNSKNRFTELGLNFEHTISFPLSLYGLVLRHLESLGDRNINQAISWEGELLGIINQPISVSRGRIVFGSGFRISASCLI
jgi:hypothetical protein